MFGKNLRDIAFALLALVGLATVADAQQGYDAGQRARVNSAAAYSLISNAAVSGAAVPGVAGGAYFIDARGTFGGTSIAVQTSLADGTFATLTTINAAGSYGPFLVPALVSIKAVVTGGSPSGLYVSARGVGPGSSSLVPITSAASFGLVNDGACASDGTNCTGTDNLAKWNAMITQVCAVSAIYNNHIQLRANVNFQGGYLFSGSLNPITCSGVGIIGNGFGGASFMSNVAGVNFVQFGTYSATPASYYSGTGGYGSVRHMQFYGSSANGTEGSRAGDAIDDYGAGVITVEDVHCVRVLYCFNAAYGGQFDYVSRLFIEYTDAGIYLGPGSQQVIVNKVDCQFVIECGVQEGTPHVTWESLNCAVVGFNSTSNHGGSCITFEANTSNTRQGVWICPGSPGSGTGCGGYTLDWRIDVNNPWVETNGAGGNTNQPLHMFRFQGASVADAMRGVTVTDPYFVMGGTQLTGSSLFGSTASTNPSRIRVSGALLLGTSPQFVSVNVGLTVKDWRTQNGSTTPSPFLSGGSVFLEPVASGFKALTPGTTVATDAVLNTTFSLTPAQNFTMSNPTNLTAGNTYVWKITQDATGTRIVTWSGNFKFAGGAAVGGVLSVTAGAVDVVTCQYDGASLYCVLSKALAFHGDMRHFATNDYFEWADPLRMNG